MDRESQEHPLKVPSTVPGEGKQEILDKHRHTTAITAVMFQEGDWNDSSDAQALTKSLRVNSSSASVSLRAGVSPGAGRKKTTKHLLETLRVLECSSKTGKDNALLVTKDSSGSEDSSTEAAPAKTKRKKKRSKRRKKGLDSNVSGSEPQQPAEKRKSSEPESSAIALKKRQREDRTANLLKEEADGAELHAGDAEGKLSTAPLLSRQRWKNMQKNKKRNKNKYRMGLEAGERSQQTEPQTAENRIPKLAKQQVGTSAHTRDTVRSNHSTVSVKVKENCVPAASTSNKTAVNKPTSSANDLGAITSKLKGRKLAKLKEILQRSGQEVLGTGGDGNEDAAGTVADQNTEVKETEPSLAPPADRSATLRTKMEERLKSARFRYINQQLYTSNSTEAQALFQKDPEAFDIYHRGFSTQVERWPENPVDLIIKYLRNRPASLVVADFGCGDCKIARSVRNTVHSFDLVALNKHVTVCDMAKVPLPDESVDIAVFCLALMGTNLRDFLAEANRILKQGGVLKVAEVASRFVDVRMFLNALANMGFKNVAKDTENSYFYMFEFTKTGPPKLKGNLPGLELKACLYKKR